MRLLITAGNAQAPIDRVRCLTNVFTGRTGARIADEAACRGHQVTLATSQPETAEAIRPASPVVSGNCVNLRIFRTFAELEQLLREEVETGSYDAIIHSAAVTDFFVADVVACDSMFSTVPYPPSLTAPDRSWRRLSVGVGKIKSDVSELWLRLLPTPKLIDQIRRPWGFRGILVKFKLEVGLGEDQLRAVAIVSCRQSDADLIVANTFEGRESEAYLGKPDGAWQRVTRADLPITLLQAIEDLHARIHPVT